MSTPTRRESELLLENLELRAQLEEAEETLRAIRAGEVDALVMGERVYTLKSAETPYRVMVEAMNEGAATLLGDGTMIYANRRLAEMLGASLQELLGAPLRRFVALGDLAVFDTMLAQGQQCSSKGELTLQGAAGPAVPVQLSCNVLGAAGPGAVCVVATELTERKRAEERAQQFNTELEQRIAERTAELHSRNRELESMNRNMIGRELRMIELKREINELCRQAGQPPRYERFVEAEQPA